MKRIIISAILAAVLLLTLCGGAFANNTKLVALTFDDGPNSVHTPTLLDILKEKNVIVSFFLLGQSAEYQPELVKRIADEGHEVCNHSYNHAWFSKLGSAAISNQVAGTDAILEDITGKPVSLLRVPYGDYGGAARSAAGKPIIQWSIDPCVGVMSKSESFMLNNIARNIHDGAVILLHDFDSKNLSVGRKTIDSLLEQDYEFVSVSELFRLRNIPLYNGVVYYSAKPGAQEQKFDENALGSHWASEYIYYTQTKGIMMGSDFGWRPNAYITRGEVAAILRRASGNPKSTAKTPFTDVSEDSWYADSVAWAQKNGYIFGVTETEFQPEGCITKEQFYAMLERYAKNALKKAKQVEGITYRDDVRISDWARESVAAFRSAGFVSKNDPEIFRPLDFITRAEAAELLTFVMRDLK